MKLIDNINSLLGDELKNSLLPGTKLKIAASCFSIYAYEALKQQLEQVDELEFIFTAPTFVEEEAVDKLNKEKREFHIPDEGKERAFFGSEFEIQLKNKLTQKAIARECADWIRRKAKFRSNITNAPMQSFAVAASSQQTTLYQTLQGFTAVDLGYEKGNAISNVMFAIEEPSFTKQFICKRR